MSKKWYCVHVQVNTENKFVEAFHAHLKLRPDLHDKFGEVFVPTEKVTEIKAGKKKINIRKLFPGYIYIEMDLDNEQMHDVMHFVRSICRGVSFIGNKTNPASIPQEDIDMMRGKMKDSTTQPKPKIAFDIGQAVLVKQGNFSGLSGNIAEIDYAKGKLKVTVALFGRPTPVELDFTDVEKEV